MSKWCVIVVPGAARKPLNAMRDLVVANLVVGEGQILQEASETSAEGFRTLKPGPGSVGAPFEQIDVVEAYWSDLIPTDAEAKPYKRLLSALGLLTYWLFDPKIWGAVFSASWFIAIGYMFAGLVMLAWALSVIVIALVALGPAAVALAAHDNLQFLAPGAATVDAGAKALGKSHLAVIAQAIATILPLLSLLVVIDLARFSRAYLQNDIVVAPIGVRASIRTRLRDRFLAVGAQDYERVIILAHSFGSLPVVDVLAELPHTGIFQKLKVITLGSPAGIFAFKSIWLRDQVSAAVARAPAKGWIDFQLKRDFWCTGLLNRQNKASADLVAVNVIDRSGSVIEGMNGVQHMRYFDEDAVLKALTS